MDITEKVCRLICKIEGVDPDRESLGCGGLIPKNQPYKLWEARIKLAKGLEDAGYLDIERIYDDN